jgi:hypothetical protein
MKTARNKVLKTGLVVLNVDGFAGDVQVTL